MKVFVKISNWHECAKFEESVEVMVFDTFEKAAEEMKLESHQVEDTFRSIYKDDFSVYNMLDDLVEIYHVNYDGSLDLWSCMIIEKDIL